MNTILQYIYSIHTFSVLLSVKTSKNYNYWTKIEINSKYCSFMEIVQNHSCLERNCWSASLNFLPFQRIESWRPPENDLFHWFLISKFRSLDPNKPARIVVVCAGWSRMMWKDLSDLIHSSTAACSRSLNLLSKSLETKKST